MHEGLIKKHALTEADLAQIRVLAEVCNRTDGINLKLNWSLMQNRDPAQGGDFCYYDSRQLVGYVPLDGFGDQYEITGMVLPAYRRQGIFQRLFDAARQEARNRYTRTLLLVNYRASQSGNAVVKRLELPYSFSEYHMEVDAAHLPSLPPSQIQLVDVTSDNVADLSRLLALNFGATEWNSIQSLEKELKRPETLYFLAELDQVRIGHIGVVKHANGVYIRAVGIAPEWRQRGYGRQLLATLVQRMLAEGHSHFELEVETDNSKALSLYQACGFSNTIIYDYYTVPF